MQRRHALAALATTATLIFSSAQAQMKEINFGIISTESSANLKSTWQPVLDDMQKATGIKVNAFLHLTTPASSKACALTRCRWHGMATSQPWKQ